MPAWCGGTGLSLHECQVYLCRENLIGRICGKAAKPHPVIAGRNEACPDWTGWDKGENHGIHQGAQEPAPPGLVADRRRDRIYGHGMRRRERGSPGPGAAPGQWTKAEVSRPARAGIPSFRTGSSQRPMYQRGRVLLCTVGGSQRSARAGRPALYTGQQCAAGTGGSAMAPHEFGVIATSAELSEAS
jgi:hypothetical protein